MLKQFNTHFLILQLFIIYFMMAASVINGGRVVVIGSVIEFAESEPYEQTNTYYDHSFYNNTF